MKRNKLTPNSHVEICLVLKVFILLFLIEKGQASVVATPNRIFSKTTFTLTTDTDTDGIIDLIDEDDDNDGVLDILEVAGDTDGDGVINRLDLDDDNDGIPTLVELGLAAYDIDMDGTLTGTGWIDTSGNGVHDNYSVIPLDSDGDSVPNYLDLDSDNDTLFDTLEYDNYGEIDSTGDGFGDGIDTDGDGILDQIDDSTGFGDSINPESLGTATNNYINVDSNNDGIYDIEETIYADFIPYSSGVINGSIDVDADGILDVFDTDTTTYGSPRNLENGDYSLHFDGENDYIEEDGEDIVLGLSEATMMAWIKLDPNFNDYGAIVGQNNFWIRINSTKRLRVEINNRSHTALSDYLTYKWTHIAAIYDGSNTSETVKLYINGVKVSSDDEVDMQPNIASSTNKKFRIGRNPSSIITSSEESFYGEIDHCSKL